MALYFKKPAFLGLLFSSAVWEIPTTDKLLFLTFDDGPTPGITDFVLQQLASFNAQATFFCIGQHVERNPGLYEKILAAGHAVGNHTWSHVDAWRCGSKRFYANIDRAASLIRSPLFRPPFGHITPAQLNRLRSMGLHTIMWSITSGDFDETITPQRCFNNVRRNVSPGAIVLMHDSMKAAVNLRYVLPKLLEQYAQEGYQFLSLDDSLVAEYLQRR